MGLFNKKKAEEKEISCIFPDSKIYFRYHVSLLEKIVAFIVGFALGAVVGYIFYELVWVSIILGVIIGVACIPLWKSNRINKQLIKLKTQFKALLESITTSIGAGRNVVDSFTGALTDMREQFSDDAYIVKELENIVSGLNNNINIEDLLRDLAVRSGIEDIMTFADVFDTCYRKGGDMKEVIGSTYKIINDKIEIEMEIRTMVSSARSELKIMCCMPIIFVFVLNTMGGNITGRGTTMGYIATTIALVIFVAAYFIGRKIMSIKV